MMTLNSTSKDKQEQQLIQYFSGLSTADKDTLLTFAAFLCERVVNVVDSDNEVKALDPEIIQRPENETVISAIKRLTASYPMVDKEQLLHSISALMTEHLMQGKTANLVIDELEVLFLNKFLSLGK